MTTPKALPASRLSRSRVGYLAAVALLLVANTACVSTTRVAAEQPGDERLSCAELATEFTKLDRVLTEARENKGVNTQNVLAAVFFLPAAAVTYLDADRAEKLVDQRRMHLMGIYRSKNC